MILLRSEQSRKCPLCARQIGEYLIHNIRSKYDYQKHYLTPLRTSPRPDAPLVRAQATQRRRAREIEWGRNQRRERERERRAADELERAIDKRRWVYRHNLYAKVPLPTFCSASSPRAQGRIFSTLHPTSTHATVLFLRPSNLPIALTMSAGRQYSYEESCACGILWTSRYARCLNIS